MEQPHTTNLHVRHPLPTCGRRDSLASRTRLSHEPYGAPTNRFSTPVFPAHEAKKEGHVCPLCDTRAPPPNLPASGGAAEKV